MEEMNNKTYSTGGVTPPKKRRGWMLLWIGMIAAGCVAVFLCVSRGGVGGNVEFSYAGETSPTQLSTLDLSPALTGEDNISQEGAMSLQEIYKKNIDSVVSVLCQLSGGYSTGTGVVLSADGYVLTNHHVIQGASYIQLLLTDGREFEATLVGSDSATDLAVLRIQANDLTAAEFGDSAGLQVGDAVVAIGDPLGVELRGTMTNGIISAINRDITTGGRTMSLIQTNAALNSGNSGGPLIDCYGRVIGINTMKMGDDLSVAGVEGLGFAIPSNVVKDVVDQLLSQGYVTGRPSLGISGEEVSRLWQLYYGMPQGVYITAVDADSDTAKKGISRGDVLLAIGETRITDTDSLTSALYAYQAGDTVSVVIYRGGRQYRVQVTLEQSK